MIMRFRPANISLINRRHYLPRLLLTLSSNYDDKNNPSDLQMLTGSHHINFRLDGHSDGSSIQKGILDATTGTTQQEPTLRLQRRSE
jgi:hypothetical protein